MKRRRGWRREGGRGGEGEERVHGERRKLRSQAFSAALAYLGEPNNGQVLVVHCRRVHARLGLAHRRQHDRRTVVVLRMMKTVLHELAHWMPGETHSHDLHWRTNQDDLVHIVLLYFKGRPAVAVQHANIFDRVRSYIGK